MKIFNRKSVLGSLLAGLGVTLGLAGVVYAKDVLPGHTQVDEAQDKAREVMNRMKPNDVQIDVPQAVVPNLPETPKVGSPDPLTVAEQMREQIRQYQPPASLMGQEGSDIYVLVSMSMPLSSLKRIAAEVAKVNGTMVFRGFIGENMRTTQTALKPFADLGAQVSIDPQLFAKLGVKQVPALVLSQGMTQGCSESDNQCVNHVIRYGDASMQYVLNHIANSSEPLASLAQAKYKVLTGDFYGN